MAISGKQVADKLYLHTSSLSSLGAPSASLVESALQISGRVPDVDFNVVRLRVEREEVTFLLYPRFFDDPFPILSQSWRVHIPTNLVNFRDYSQSLNPPVLHRKELLLVKDHPDRSRFEQLTNLSESLGLFDDPGQIGFLRQWKDAIASKGYRIAGHHLLPIGNATEGDEYGPIRASESAVDIQRHLTALTRTTLSAPVQSLLRHELLRKDTSFFDYGCGKGDDVAALASLGIAGQGWDPHFRPDGMLMEADIVNIGFVINVIEDFDERIAALSHAYVLCRQVLAVAVMLQSTGYTGRNYRDGVLTSRNTFQKYYTQLEVQQFIESVLDESASPVGPGVFYVFKDRAIEQRFYLTRSSSRTRALRAVLVPGLPKTPRLLREPRPAAIRSEDPLRAALIGSLWDECLKLGRVPVPEEVTSLAPLVEAFGSFGRALSYCQHRQDVSALARSAAARRDELLVFFALQLFSHRHRFQDLDRHLQLDVKAFFGSLANAEAEARSLLYSIRDVNQITRACAEAADLGLGWLELGHALHLHSSLIERLPALLRVYIGCATVMYGDVTQMDLVKIHLLSGKVTVMRFDDFTNKPLPAMLERVKVRLRDQAVDVFKYGEDFPPPLVYRKSRFINEEFPNFAAQQAFDDDLESLKLVDLSGFGPPAADFWCSLEAARWSVSGFQLVRSTSIPELESHCSEHFTYRRLIECGHTWHANRVVNVPQQPDTFTAIAELAHHILEPVVDYYGAIRLTYGFCSNTLARLIRAGPGGIAPRLDQHASHELNTKGARICIRGGAAVDFLVDDEDMREVADWIAKHLPFDRLYYYGPARPLHVSYGSENSRAYIDIEERNGRRLPKPARMSSAP